MRFFSWTILLTTLIGCGQATQTPPKERNDESKKEPTLPVSTTTDPALTGSWELKALPQSNLPFQKLYPRQKPILLIQPAQRMISGSTGCNRFSASITTLGNQLNFTDFSSSTLVCVGEAESTFLSAWENSKKYFLKDNEEMVWGTDSVSWMIFKRR